MIREFKPEDTERIRQIILTSIETVFSKCYPDWAVRALRSHYQHVDFGREYDVLLVAEDGGRPVGCMGLKDRDVKTLYVDHTMLSARNVAFELCEGMRTISLSKGYEKVTMSVSPAAAGFVKWYGCNVRGYAGREVGPTTQRIGSVDVPATLFEFVLDHSFRPKAAEGEQHT